MSDSDGDIAYAVDKGKAGDTGQELGYVKQQQFNPVSF